MHKEVFLSEIFERSPSIFPGAIFSQEYSWDMLTSDFYGISPVGTEIRVYQESLKGKEEYLLASQHGLNSSFDFEPDALANMLTEGATIVVNRFDRHSIFTSHLCQEVRRLTDVATVGNAYISKGSSTTFGLHWDRHCVFVAQIIGSKRWSVYKPTLELPLKHQLSSDYKPSGPTGQPAFEVTLDEGDMLYLPRGWWHQTSTIDGEPSFHITLGIHTHRVYDFIRWVMTNKMSDYIQMRNSFRESTHSNIELMDGAVAALAHECSMQSNWKAFFQSRSQLEEISNVVDFSKIMRGRHG